MRYLKATMGTDPAGFGVPCLYDAEAIFVEREIARRAASGRPLPEAECARLLTEEINLARGTAGVLAVSDRDRRVFEAHGVTNVWTVGHAIEPCPTPRPPRARDAILFVGAFGPGSPNEDAARLLCGEITTALARTPAGAAPIVVAGSGIPHSLREEFPGVSWLADLDDLTEQYDRARVFVVPTRFAAGMPWKIGEAAAHGVPIVCTPLLANQLGWTSGRELLTAETADDFARAISQVFESDAGWTALREAALTRMALDYAPETFRAALSTAMQTARQATRETRAHPLASARAEAAPDDSTRA
jgi:glycosyltransferase involved in cell wall biosynthesis